MLIRVTIKHTSHSFNSPAKMSMVLGWFKSCIVNTSSASWPLLTCFPAGPSETSFRRLIPPVKLQAGFRQPNFRVKKIPNDKNSQNKLKSCFFLTIISDFLKWKTEINMLSFYQCNQVRHLKHDARNRY